MCGIIVCLYYKNMLTFIFTSTVIKNLFEICIPVKLLLILREMKHWETT